MQNHVGPFRIAYDLWRQYGTWNFGYRLYHAAWRRAGLLKRRFPAQPWSNSTAARLDGQPSPAQWRDRLGANWQGRARFFFNPHRLPRLPAEWTADAIRKADDILAGRLSYFSGQTAELGFPFDWFLNPFTTQRVDAGRHWCDRDDFEPAQGDIKIIWEASRFSWVFPLVRAFAATRDDRYAAAFWQLVESWRQANPPNMGPNWQCGQECALRAMAACFGLYGFASSRESTPDRMASLIAMLAVHAARIERNIRFAETQMSNHALSEAVGLYSIGTLFPDLARADLWRRRGKHVVEREARLHSYADGSYIQHSMNYHRVMMHDYLWALRLAELNGDAFSPRVHRILDRHTDFVYMLQEPASGFVPNYGQNDGALVLPLNACPYLDYRPVAQAMYYQLRRKRLYPPGPYDEDLHWLFGPEAADAPTIYLMRESKRYDVGGYYVLRGRETWGFLRCHSFRHHPHQADMLHLDVWWRGQNVLRDSGSYSYNAPEPWKNYFVSTRAHNTIELGGQSQMIKARRFTWVYLTRSRLHAFWPSIGPDVDFVQGEHYGYRRLASKAVHRRAVLRVGERYWIVVDDVFGRGAEQVCLAWHLLDAPYELTENAVLCTTESGPFSLVVLAPNVPANRGVARGQESPTALGWQSLHYGEKLPAPTFWLDGRMPLPARLVSVVGLGAAIEADLTDNRLSVRDHAGRPTCQVELGPMVPGGAAAIRRLILDGEVTELASETAERTAADPAKICQP